jgi:hypothetical protein
LPKAPLQPSHRTETENSEHRKGRKLISRKSRKLKKVIKKKENSKKTMLSSELAIG